MCLRDRDEPCASFEFRDRVSRIVLQGNAASTFREHGPPLVTRILIFVGVKMVWLNDLFGGKFPIEWSLGIITALLAAAVLASWLWGPPDHRAGEAASEPGRP